MVGCDERGGDCTKAEPPLGVALVHMERTGPNVFLIEQNVADQLARQWLDTLGVARIIDPIAGILQWVLLRGRLRRTLTWGLGRAGVLPRFDGGRDVGIKRSDL